MFGILNLFSNMCQLFLNKTDKKSIIIPYV